jgi:GNAT superfamily N-acetyltransferase
MKIKKINNIKKAAQLALTNRLFVPGWLLRCELVNILKYSYNNYEIALAFKNNIPVGICLKKHRFGNNNQLMVFVKKSHRKQGIGRKLVSFMKDSNSYGEIGIKKSNGKIWELNGIEIR